MDKKNEYKVDLDIIIEKLSDDVIVPADNCEGLQVRHDGIFLNGELHFWEEILTVIITNRKLLNELKQTKENKCFVCPDCGNPYFSADGNAKCINCLDTPKNQENKE